MSTLDIAAFKARVNSIPAKTAVNAKWILTSILKVVEDLATTTSDQNRVAESKLGNLVEHVIASKKTDIRTVYAGDMTMQEVAVIFQLDIDEQRIGEFPFSVVAPEPFEVPDILNTSFQLYRHTPYDPNCEASSRILVDLALMACFDTLNLTHNDHFLPAAIKSPLVLPNPQLTVFPELELRATITDPRTDTLLNISGRADWAYGYGSRTNYHSGNMLVAIEAKQPTTLSSARPQLLAYLALMRYFRQQAGKTNPDVQGCYTDGKFYTFMSIRANGNVEISRQFSFLNLAERKVIFNFLVSMLETSAKCTPTASPSKGTKREREVARYPEVMSKRYAPYCDEEPRWMEDVDTAIGTGEVPFGL